ncbi:FAD-binding oxidoreductase, partial [bacterium]|nr:FAD-binding oxidoreductase [bacterium]
MDKSALEGLAKQLPSGAVVTAPEEMAPYATDWTRVPGKPSAVLLPRNVQEVSLALAYCHAHGIPVVPSGGRTGLAAGAVPTRGEVVLNMSRLDTIAEPSVLARTLRVGAGAITERVHEKAAEAGLIWPIDLASKGSCQIGGNLSTNAGGLRVIRYGMTRKWVTRLQVVKMDGTILELNADLEKNNTGYDLLQMVVGSEGTLCAVTEATLKLAPQPSDRGKAVMLFGLPTAQGVAELFEHCRRGPFEILAFEFFSDRCLAAVEKQLGRRCRFPDRHAYYALMEIAGEAPREEWLAQTLALSGVRDALQAESSDDRRAVWGLREGITESLARTGPLRKHDLCVPLRSMASFLGEVDGIAPREKLKVDVYFFGHFGDGSPHVNLVNPAGVSFEEFERDCDRYEVALFDLVKKYSGSISSEHGIGLLKKKWLSYSRTQE